jgi:TRAP transporter TAXI family solute receptor
MAGNLQGGASMIIRTIAAGAALAAGLAAAPMAEAQTRVTLKSAKAGSSYYQMAVQVAEAAREATGGEVDVTVEESQGSVQNVMEARARGADYVFTAPPSLVEDARAGRGDFEGRADPAFDEIRALFPLPSLTMHVVVAEATGAEALEDLAGLTILLGQGSFGATEGERYLELFGLADAVAIADAELSSAVAALQNGQIDGFVTAGSYPAPNVVEAAASEGVRVLSLSEEQVAETGRSRVVIPAGTYPGQEADVVTTALPVVSYATSAMEEETAYALTKAFWESKDAMAESGPWWDGVTSGSLAVIEGPLHPGAARYYEEAGIALPGGQG